MVHVLKKTLKFIVLLSKMYNAHGKVLYFSLILCSVRAYPGGEEFNCSQGGVGSLNRIFLMFWRFTHERVFLLFEDLLKNFLIKT